MILVVAKPLPVGEYVIWIRLPLKPRISLASVRKSPASPSDLVTELLDHRDVFRTAVNANGPRVDTGDLGHVKVQ